MRANCLVWIFLFLAVSLSAQTITTQPTNQIVAFGGNVAFSVSVSGTGSFTYQWQFNGTNLPDNIITTVAGNGPCCGATGSFSGDGGAATSAGLYYPAGMAFDASGNLFIADADNNRIRKVSTNGIITTFAGNGTASFSGDGGTATNASLHGPFGLAFDASGNLFIAEIYNNRIREVSTNGTITTVAGNGTSGYSGDGGAATNASLYYPSGVAFDSNGNLFIADSANNRIRKVSTNGIITTVAGDGPSYPSPGSYSGDGGAATNANLYSPYGIALDILGNLFIADQENQRVREVSTNGIITTVAGNGSTYGDYGDGGAATSAGVFLPTGVALDAYGNLFIADNFRIREVNTNGVVMTVAGKSGGYSGDGGAATNANITEPGGVALNACGDLFIGDSGNNRVREVFAFGSLPTLSLENVTTNNAGSYGVIITGMQGSVTSSVVTLTITMSPSIAGQPQPLTVTNGYPASFLVSADGSPTLAYQWFFNGTNLPDATNTMLELQNAFPTNAGAYTVVVTNDYGSATSNPAMLTVLPLGIIAPTMLASRQFQFSFDTATRVDYEVEYSTNLTQWLPLVTLGGIGVPLTVIDPNTSGSQQRFYRIILSPQ